MPTWLESAREKAGILQSGIASAIAYANEAGLSEDQLRMMLEPYQTALEEVYADDFSLAKVLDASDLVVHIEGPALDTHAPRITLLSSFFTNVNAEVRKIAAAILGVGNAHDLPTDLNLGLAAVAPGSLYLGLKVQALSDAEALPLGEAADPYLDATKQAVKTLGVVSRTVSETPTAQSIAMPPMDPLVRDVALSAVQRLSPSDKAKRGGVDSVELSIPGAPGESPSTGKLTPETRRELKRHLDAPLVQTVPGEFEGWIREVDLDLRRFELRRVEIGNSMEVRCRYESRFEAQVKSLLDRRVRVSGQVQLNPAGKPSLMEIESIQSVA